MATQTRSKSAAEKLEEAPVPAGLPIIKGNAGDINLLATRFIQGRRVNYALTLSIPEIQRLIAKPDPKVLTVGNRMINEKHADEFGQYPRKHENWFSPALTLRSASDFSFQRMTEEDDGPQIGVLSFPAISAGDIHILDGQHRILGFHKANEAISQDLDKQRSALATARRLDPAGRSVKDAQNRIAELEAQRKRLAGERVIAQLVIEADVAAYRQIFFDVAENQKGISASVKARFDSRKVVNRTMELVYDHPLFLDKVDPEKDRVGRGSFAIVGAKHVAEIVKTVGVGLNGRVGVRAEAELNEKGLAQATKTFLTTLTDAFPDLAAVANNELTPDGLRKKSLLGSVVILRVLGGAYYDLLQKGWKPEAVGEFFTRLAPHMDGPVYPGSIWMEHGEVFRDGAMAPQGRRQDLQRLNDLLVEWAMLKPEWLNEKPAPRPEPYVDPLEGAGYKENSDELLALHE